MSKARTDRRPNETADQPLMGMPEPPPPEPPEPSAGQLVAAWCRGWSEANGGQQPHAAVVRRVAGVCRNIGKDCAVIEDWSAAWRASLMAGRAGRYDVVGYLAAPVQQTRGNHYLAIARAGEPPSVALGQALAPRALGGGA